MQSASYSPTGYCFCHFMLYAYPCQIHQCYCSVVCFFTVHDENTHFGCSMYSFFLVDASFLGLVRMSVSWMHNLFDASFLGLVRLSVAWMHSLFNASFLGLVRMSVSWMPSLFGYAFY